MIKNLRKNIFPICLIVFLVGFVSILSLCGCSDGEADSNKAKTAKVGETIKMSDGMEVTVVSLTPGFKDYDGKQLTKAVITYANHGKKDLSYNPFDWKAQDDKGNQTNYEIFVDGDTKTQLSSGSLAINGTVTGELYFTTPVVKMLYSSSLGSDTNATWTTS